MTEVTFAASAFPPLALGFFGLGVGYLIWGPQEMAAWPAASWIAGDGEAIGRRQRRRSETHRGGASLEAPSPMGHDRPVRGQIRCAAIG